MVGTPRSGSMLLCSKLWESGQLGAPWEYFNISHALDFLRRLDPRRPQDYYTRLQEVRTSPNGVFGYKMFYSHFTLLRDRYPDLYKRVEDDVSGGARLIHLRRRDRVAQAVSLARAIRSGAWAGENRDDAGYDRAFIQQCLDHLDWQDRGWELWMAERGVAPLYLDYEDLTRDMEGWMARLADFIDPPAGGPACAPQLPAMQRQSDAISAAWIRQFLEGAAPRPTIPSLAE